MIDSLFLVKVLVWNEEGCHGKLKKGLIEVNKKDLSFCPSEVESLPESSFLVIYHTNKAYSVLSVLMSLSYLAVF